MNDKEFINRLIAIKKDIECGLLTREEVIKNIPDYERYEKVLSNLMLLHKLVNK